MATLPITPLLYGLLGPTMSSNADARFDYIEIRQGIFWFTYRPDGLRRCKTYYNGFVKSRVQLILFTEGRQIEEYSYIYTNSTNVLNPTLEFTLRDVYHRSDGPSQIGDGDLIYHKYDKIIAEYEKDVGSLRIFVRDNGPSTVHYNDEICWHYAIEDEDGSYSTVPMRRECDVTDRAISTYHRPRIDIIIHTMIILRLISICIT